MANDARLHRLDIDIPAQPEGLAKLSRLLDREEVDLHEANLLIGADMALAAAVLKAVNSARYGLLGRVQSVQHAITYLGMREVAAVTFEMGLRAIFPAAPELEPLWERAGVRGLLMGRIAQALSLDAGAAHSAGLFEECGKAVILRHARERYRPLLEKAENDEDLLMLEHAEFGVGHDVLGAALCESWGVAAPAVDSVRFHVVVNSTLELPMQLADRSICALSAVAHALMTDPDQADEVARKVAPHAGLEALQVQRAARRVREHIEATVARRED
ncbi:MAG: HDOD domain-containing protein [Caldimonas sp.]